MPHYRRVGHVPPKRHTVFTDDAGERFHEELMGQHGFSSNSSLLYHRRSPSAIESVEPIPNPDPAPATDDHPLTPRHLRTAGLAGSGNTPTDMVLGRHALLCNDDVRIAWVSATVDSPIYRNVSGDELLFIQRGSAVLDSVFGCLTVGHGDYVVIPAGTTHRWLVGQEHGPLEALVIESSGHVGPPRRYLSGAGQFLEHSPYCERDLRAPTEPNDAPAAAPHDDGPVQVVVRNRAGCSLHTHRHHPFDVVGWDGTLYPWVFNIADFEPIVGSLHQPPPVHQTFEAPGIVVCSFVPRLFDTHPDAVKIPYHHANTDSDEVLFYSAGNFMSRAGSGIGVGSISFHPAGFIHGPQPGSYEASVEHARTEETAVMIDTFRPLQVTEAARSVSDPGYPTTWAR